MKVIYCILKCTKNFVFTETYVSEILQYEKVQIVTYITTNKISQNTLPLHNFFEEISFLCRSKSIQINKKEEFFIRLPESLFRSYWVKSDEMHTSLKYLLLWLPSNRWNEVQSNFSSAIETECLQQIFFLFTLSFIPLVFLTLSDILASVHAHLCTLIFIFIFIGNIFLASSGSFFLLR